MSEIQGGTPQLNFSPEIVVTQFHLKGRKHQTEKQDKKRSATSQAGRRSRGKAIRKKQEGDVMRERERAERLGKTERLRQKKKRGMQYDVLPHRRGTATHQRTTTPFSPRFLRPLERVLFPLSYVHGCARRRRLLMKGKDKGGTRVTRVIGKHNGCVWLGLRAEGMRLDEAAQYRD